MNEQRFQRLVIAVRWLAAAALAALTVPTLLRPHSPLETIVSIVEAAAIAFWLIPFASRAGACALLVVLAFAMVAHSATLLLFPFLLVVVLTAVEARRLA